MKKYGLIFFLSLVMSGCSLFAVKPTEVLVADASVDFSYSGRGAGAGVALMSTMGPVGIAVGVAIDEGIRKDLKKSADAAGFDIAKMVEEVNLSQWSDYGYERIVIREYGMKDVSGMQDVLCPYVVIELVENGEPSLLEFNVDSLSEADLKQLHTLAEYKHDGNFIVAAFKLVLEAGASE